MKKKLCHFREIIIKNAKNIRCKNGHRRNEKMKLHIKKEFGNTGEDIATEYLEKQGYIILERNFYCKQGEIDIIAKDKNEVVFVEVKSRSNVGYGLPSEAVTKQKIKHLCRAARYFLYKNKMFNEFIRFDVVEILIKSGKFNVNHIKQII